MDGWLETYRGAVAPWECDVVEHFTVAYYFDRFSDATLAVLEALDLGPTAIRESHRGCATVSCDVRYERELRAGDVFHIESGVVEAEGKRLRLAHRVIDSATGETVTRMDQLVIHLDTAARKSIPLPDDKLAAAKARLIDWDPPVPEPRAEPVGDAGFVDAFRDSTKPWEIDVVGHVGFQFYVHRFSAAMAQAMAGFGLTPALMRDTRRGFSTFEFELRFQRELNAGEMVTVKTGLVHLGNTSMRFLHRLYNQRTGELAASLSQYGVLLDMEARRPARLPEAVRQRAEATLVPAK
ncbi:MAG: thioesterase family protein [Minwuiales bacterium]|nr:thioesterase family protein [Minwuiales bacterium]